MKYAVPLMLAAALGAASVEAQSRIFRCGNTYTNDVAEAQAKGCKPIEGGNVTIVQGTRVQAPASRPASGGAPSQRVDASDQRARDADARLILDAELRKAEARQAELRREYNNGEPERRGDERNYQKYLDRVAELKAALERNEADIAGIRRELARHGGGAPSASK